MTRSQRSPPLFLKLIVLTAKISKITALQVGFGMTDPGVMWHPEGLTRFDPSPKKLIIDHTPYVIPRASYTVANLVAKAAGLCTGVCEVQSPCLT